MTFLEFMTWKNQSEKITAKKIAEDNAYIYTKCLKRMVSEEVKRNAAVIEGVCDTVGKTADNEKWNCKKQRNIMKELVSL